jgi:hypothetical protein
MASSAEALLAEPCKVPNELMPYLLAAHMSGLLLQGDQMAAIRSFQRNRGNLTGGGAAWEPVFRLLVGRATG